MLLYNHLSIDKLFKCSQVCEYLRSKFSEKFQKLKKVIFDK